MGVCFIIENIIIDYSSHDDLESVNQRLEDGNNVCPESIKVESEERRIIHDQGKSEILIYRSKISKYLRKRAPKIKLNIRCFLLIIKVSLS